jgi:signal transduction histidine kinase/CheY-like chemotaxis protein
MNDTNNENFRNQLIAVFTVIVIVFAVIIIIINIEAKQLNITGNTIYESQIPTSQASQRLATGIHHSLASLRGWMILGKERFKLDRALAWQKEILPSIEQLRVLSNHWAVPENIDRLNLIVRQVGTLKNAQHEIEAISNSLKATPALKILDEEATPLANIMANNITLLFEIQYNRRFNVNHKALYKAMSDFRGSLGLAKSDLRLFLLTGKSKIIRDFERHWQANSEAFRILTEHKELLTAAQLLVYYELVSTRKKFTPLPKKIFEIHQQKKTRNIANYLLSHNAVPAAQNILQTLDVMVVNQRELLTSDFVAFNDEISELPQLISISISIGIFFVIILGAIMGRSLKQIQQVHTINLKTIEETARQLNNVNNSLTNENILQQESSKIYTAIQQAKNINQFSESFLQSLAQFNEIGIASCFIDTSFVNTENSKLITFERVSTYGYSNKKSCTNEDSIQGELVEECIKSQRCIELSQIPEGYFWIKSGIGNHPLTTLLLIPIVFETATIGVIELGSFKMLTQSQKTLINRVIPYMGIVINNLLFKAQTEMLLQQSQEQSENLERSQRQLQSKAHALEVTSKYKSEFLATMSHEIRTPMNGVLGMLGVLLRSNLNEEQKSKAELAQSSAGSLLTIINDILDFSKVEAGKLELEQLDFDLLHFLNDVINTMAIKAQEKQIDLLLDTIEVEHSMVTGDVGRLRQVLTNLIGNAIKFTDKGRVTVQVSCKLLAHQLQFECKVSDTGIGVEKDKVETLFDAFQQADNSTTRQYGGTGLGLSIVKQLVNLMQGNVNITKIDTGGSVFEFNIMLGKSQLEAPAPIDLHNKNILIIDNNPYNLSVLKALTEKWGGKVVVSEAFDTTIAELSANKPDQFDYIFISRIDQEERTEQFIESRLSNDATKRSQTVVINNIKNLAGDSAINSKFNFNITVPVTEYGLRVSLSNTTLLEPSNSDADLQQGSNWPKDTRVLVVEDNLINQKVIRAQLSYLKLAVDIAVDGNECLQALLSCPKDLPYSLILMDCQMPNMDGYEATKAIRDGAGYYKDIPVIALTANAMAGDKEKCLNSGMSDYLSKPIKQNTLIEMLKKWLV